MSEKMLKALKIFIVVSGMLIMAGFLMVGVELSRRAGRASHPAPDQALAYGLHLPKGTQLAEVGTTPDRVMVRAILPQGEQRLYFFSTSDGQLIATVFSGEPQ